MPIVKGGEGAAFRLKRGNRLKIVNTHGSQVVDVFAHNAADLGETLSIQHSRNVWYRLQPHRGDQGGDHGFPHPAKRQAGERHPQLAGAESRIDLVQGQLGLPGNLDQERAESTLLLLLSSG